MPKEYIDRETAKEAIFEYICGHTMSKFLSRELLDASKKGAEGAMNELDYVPAADVAPVVHGEWVLVDHDEYGKQYECSVCGRSVVTRGNVTPPYCRCGAKMDGGGQDRFADIGKMYSEIKAEAIREFAERLKNKFYSYYEGLDENTSKSKYNGETLMYYEVADMIENCIDNTVKELTEEQNEP